MKYLLMILVVGAVLWLMIGKPRRAEDVKRREGQAPHAPNAPNAPNAPQAMLQCAHCGVHLPAADAVVDAGGRPYCGEAHRLAGPRTRG